MAKAIHASLEEQKKAAEEFDTELQQALKQSAAEEAERKRNEELEEQQVLLAPVVQPPSGKLWGEVKTASPHYQLASFVAHSGLSPNEGHYIAFVRDFTSGTWKKYDDSIGKTMPESEALGTLQL